MKRLWQLLLVILCIAVLTNSVFASGTQVDEMNIALTVDQNGTARAEASIHVVSDVPMDSFSISLGANVSGVQVSGYKAHVSHTGNQTTVNFTASDGLPSTMDLFLTYTIRNTVESEGDAQHFSVRLLGGCRDANIKKLTASVQMPAAFTSEPVFTSGYFADQIDNYLDIHVSDAGLLTVSNTELMLAGETLDVTIDTEPDYFILHNVAGRTLLFDKIAMIVLALFGLLYWWRSLRSPLPSITEQSQPPMGVEPGTCAMLMLGQAPDLPLMVMNWAANGYLRVGYLQKKKVSLTRLMPMGNERNSYEQAVFNRLFAHSSEVLCGSNAWKSAQKKADKAALHYWNARLYEDNPGNPKLLRAVAVLFCGVAALFYADLALPSMQLRVLLLALIALAGLVWGLVVQLSLRHLFMHKYKKSVLCLLCCVLVMAIAWRIGGNGKILLLGILFSVLVGILLLLGAKRKRSGVDLLSELMGWARYLRNLTPKDAQQRLKANPQYYYETLPFAQALGVGKKFSRAFADCKLDECAFIEKAGKPLPRQPEKFHSAFIKILAIARDE